MNYKNDRAMSRRIVFAVNPGRENDEIMNRQLNNTRYGCKDKKKRNQNH